MTDFQPRVLIVDQNLARATILEEGLREAGYADLVVVRDMQNLMRRILDEQPDVILIDLENPNRDVLEQMFQVSRVVQKPVAMFVDTADRGTIEAAIDAGVSAYVVDGLRKERVRAIVETSVSRFRAFEKLRTELDDTRKQLADRKLIDRARGILMQQRGLNEEQAYEALRKAAMDNNLRLAEVARSVITAAGLLKP
ncbi:MAG: ANTAR domain-containing protein [Pseudomonadota bacterium]|jgi:response regulator NasT|nr:ANTAR domain-containing protein [Pseudomonadota bacterium]HWL62033.1 ANTAR domain-containing protein [Steroidobacteraceae bacterium]